jgi:hypothetical protein
VKVNPAPTTSRGTPPVPPEVVPAGDEVEGAEEVEGVGEEEEEEARTVEAVLEKAVVVELVTPPVPLREKLIW